jgi:hypothetical protein
MWGHARARARALAALCPLMLITFEYLSTLRRWLRTLRLRTLASTLLHPRPLAAPHPPPPPPLLPPRRGDANYRRLLGDRHWPHDTPFAAAVAYRTTAFLALRTLKAGLICGVDPARAAAAAASASNWLVAGRFGVVQFAARRA